MTIAPGLTARVLLTVGEADLAPAHRSGDMCVLATPRLVALCEEATVAAIAPHLPAEVTSVGARVELDHLAPSSRGARVEATASLEEVAGRRLSFRVTVLQDGRPVARGRVERVIVERDRFGR